MSSYQRIPGHRHKAPSTMEVYEFIKPEVSAGRPFPTVRQIADRQGWGHSAANDTLARLVRKGYLKVTQRKKIANGNGWTYSYALREDVAPEK
jgi:hypothetical protein